jgi:murein DD-endopeptidase MepM/ murein hydrolase activator NlpD
MAQTWQATRLARPGFLSIKNALTGVLRRFALSVSDLPTMSRYVGHVCLALLLYVTLWNLSFRPVERPAFAYAADDSLAEPYEQVSLSAIGAASQRYLERAAVPMTMNVMRSILPMTTAKRTARTSVTTYRVQAGDTLLDIAQNFGLNGTTLLYSNETLALNPDFLKVGQELYVLPVDGAYHTVASGDTLDSIATTYKADATVIASFPANQLQPPYDLKVGDKLVIPGGAKPYQASRVLAYSGPIPAGAKQGSGSFAWPMSGLITQRYWEGHLAIDIGAPSGTRIVASDSGFVATVQLSNAGYGNMIIIDHGNGFRTLYSHFSVVYMTPGQSVAKGELIGLCGSTGNSTGPHVHFEVIYNGVRRNPLNYLP